MSLLRFALKNIAGNRFRSLVVLACALIVSGFALATTLIIRGAESSLAQADQRLGADILVVPKGSSAASKSALMMGKPTAGWMTSANLERISRVSGVQVVSPQLYLGTLRDSPNCVAAELYVVALEPLTDFTVASWLVRPLPKSLGQNEAIGGTFVTPDPSGVVDVFGVPVKLVENLEPIGTGMDQTIFVTFETAHDILSRPRDAKKYPAISQESVSSALVRVQVGYAVPAVAMQIQQVAPDVSAIDSPSYMQAQRKQISGLSNTVLAALSVGLLLAVAAIYLIFTMAVNERRWQIGVLRALGARQNSVFVSLLLEANLLGLAGGAMGLLLSCVILYLRRDDLIAVLQIPFLLPTIESLALYILFGLAAIAASVTLSALFPALSISRQEPSLAMRE